MGYSMVGSKTDGWSIGLDKSPWFVDVKIQQSELIRAELNRLVSGSKTRYMKSTQADIVKTIDGREVYSWNMCSPTEEIAKSLCLELNIMAEGHADCACQKPPDQSCLPPCKECDGSGFKKGGVRMYCGCKPQREMTKMVSVDMSLEEAVTALEKVFGPEWNRIEIQMMQPGFQRMRKAVTREK